MQNIGLIGKTEILKPYTKQILKNQNFNIVGKASVGSSDQLNSFHFSIPELNKIEVIERADIILIDNSNLHPFDLLCDIVKKSKHIFATQYLNLTVDECVQLLKLTDESKTVIQFVNPYFFTPAVHWLNSNLAKPTFLDISNFSPDMESKGLLPMLLMFLGITGLSPKKISAVSFSSSQPESKFNNVRLEFGDASVVNLNYGDIDSLHEFKIRAYSPGQFVTLNFTNETYNFNNKPIDLSPFSEVNEFDSFIDSILNKAHTISGIEDYLAALQTLQKINVKIAQFSQ
ncbi:MAG: hypothetical protein J7L95_02545 [Prolixibacteraceae bacterium]|nr:hypothetical protein [Prolixibacteraceae bacterium]